MPDPGEPHDDDQGLTDEDDLFFFDDQTPVTSKQDLMIRRETIEGVHQLNEYLEEQARDR